MKICDIKKEFETISEYENIFMQDSKFEKKKFQRLEFLGDKVLGLILSSLLFDKYSYYTEGKLSRTLSYLCSGKVLCKIAIEIKLDLYFEKKKKYMSQKGLVDCLEAIIGAFYQINGFKKTKNMIYSLWKSKFKNISDIKADSKTLLQEWSQSKKLGLPKYILSKQSPDHAPTFTIKVKVQKYNL